MNKTWRKAIIWLGISLIALWNLGTRGDASNTIPIRDSVPNYAQIDPAADHHTYLPVITRWYDPSYISAFGFISYGGISNANGLQQMKDAGSKWATTSLNWALIEPTKGTYDWSSFDSTAQNAQAAGIDVFVLFTGNPSWAAKYPGGPLYNTQDLVHFASLMAERYDCDGVNDAPGSPCVHYWSFYGEPDNGSESYAQHGRGYWGHKGPEYAAMLKKVSPAIHQADPDAHVMIGGLAYDYFESDRGPFVKSFLADTLRTLQTYPGGAEAYIDAVAFHFYPISVKRWPTIREKAAEIRGIMNQYGAGSLPLLCPEAGYWSSAKFGSSEEKQARRLVQMYTRALSIDIGLLSWYKVFDAAWAGSDEDKYPDRTSGLFRVNATPKPAYYAYQIMTRELDLASYRRSFQATNIEGYIFTMPGGKEKTVLWATTASAKASFPGSCQRVVQIQGAEQKINDGQNGDLDRKANGWVQIQVAQDRPVYVGTCH